MLIDVLEKWAVINCYNIRPNTYMVSSYGRFMNLHTGQFLKARKNNTNDYMVIGLLADKETYHAKYRILLVHRLVAIYFCPGWSPEHNTVNHIDGNKAHNVWYNLEWVSQGKNNEEAKRLLLNRNFGCTHYQSRLNPSQVQRICQLLELGVSYNDILIQIGIEPSKNNNELIGNIKRRRTYGSISKDYNF